MLLYPAPQALSHEVHHFQTCTCCLAFTAATLQKHPHLCEAVSRYFFHVSTTTPTHSFDAWSDS